MTSCRAERSEADEVLFKIEADFTSSVSLTADSFPSRGSQGQKLFQLYSKFANLQSCAQRHIFCENKFSRKISLRSSKSPYRTFLMAIIKLEVGLFSLRLGHGAALTCHRHVIHSRADASLPLELPRCAVIFTQQHGFLQSQHKFANLQSCAIIQFWTCILLRR